MSYRVISEGQIQRRILNRPRRSANLGGWAWCLGRDGICRKTWHPNVSGLGENELTGTAISAAFDAAAAAKTKIAQSENALKAILQSRAGNSDPSYYPKDSLYFGGLNFSGYLEGDGVRILIRVENIVGDVDKVLASLGSTWTQYPNAVSAHDAVMHAKQDAQALLQKWKWYEFKGSSGSTNIIDQAQAYVEQGGRMLKQQAKDIVNPDLWPDWLKWGFGLFLGIEILKAFRK